MPTELTSQAKAIIEKILYITLATVTEDGRSWNSPVYTSYDEDYNFYWASWKENTHSKNIMANPKVFAVIYDSTIVAGQGIGVYMEGRAYELSQPQDIENAFKYHYGRKKQAPRKVEEFLGDYPRRMYKFVPEKFWINTDERINGNYIDKKIEIDLRDKK
ncbi:MAG TPA: pyridoxamine 5'-phosphate oxidase family protein [Candidatus Paceibacterota bacterium]|nr:pyridoxamine 5'-phosphate oxidase family protein [Candidatus Paceibacterota bacterium]